MIESTLEHCRESPSCSGTMTCDVVTSGSHDCLFARCAVSGAIIAFRAPNGAHLQNASGCTKLPTLVQQSAQGIKTLKDHRAGIVSLKPSAGNPAQLLI
jgi:hypothetical protein